MLDIILPCYNSDPRLVNQALDSIARQRTKYRYSVYVIDDGSDTLGLESATVTCRFVYRFVYHRIDHSGLPAALNVGHSLGNRKYCCWTSDDNLLAPTFVQRMVETAEQGFDFVRSLERHLPGGEITDPRHGNSALPVTGKYDGYLGASHIYSRELYERTRGYDRDMAGIEDLDFFWSLMDLNPRVGFIAELLYTYRDGTSRFTEAEVAEARRRLIAKWRLK